MSILHFRYGCKYTFQQAVMQNQKIVTNFHPDNLFSLYISHVPAHKGIPYQNRLNGRYSPYEARKEKRSEKADDVLPLDRITLRRVCPGLGTAGCGIQDIPVPPEHDSHHRCKNE
jgi:hypothetical protein